MGLVHESTFTLYKYNNYDDIPLLLLAPLFVLIVPAVLRSSLTIKRLVVESS